MFSPLANKKMQKNSKVENQVEKLQKKTKLEMVEKPLPLAYSPHKALLGSGLE